MTKFESNLSAVIEELQNKDVLQDAKDVDLQKQINNEATARTNAEAQLQTNIDNANYSRSVIDQSLQEQIDALNIAGTIQYFARQTAPGGWLKADGTAVSRKGYPSLFAAIGTLYGAGDGSTTFNVPDLRGEFIRGVDDGRGVDAERKLGSLQTDDFKSHTHFCATYNGQSGVYETAYTTGGYDYGTQAPPTTSVGGSETRPRNVALLACIKY